MESAKKISTISDIVKLISVNLTGSQQKVIYLKKQCAAYTSFYYSFFIILSKNTHHNKH